MPPSINVQSATPQTSTPPPPAKQGTDETRKVDQQLQAPPKAPSRGPSGKSTLETVQENSADAVAESPAAIQAAADLKPLTRISEDEPESKKRDTNDKPGESGSESAGNKSDSKRGRRASLTQTNPNASVPRPKGQAKGSYPPLASAKSRQAESKPNMTVETETVQSIPQSALNAGDRSGSGRTEPGRSIRLKPSNETIRPKKERKKPTQKARSINQGTGTLYTSRSPLLMHRGSFEDEGYVSSIVASSASTSDEQSPQKRVVSGTQAWWRPAVMRRPSQYIRSLSDRYVRKASSKADIFEQRVANAVDEANASDSDETFVYESNPPEPQRRPRHHSRTPSVTSAHSTTEQQRGGIRAFGDVLDDRRVAGKRSMKFSSTHDPDTPDSKNGTVRSSRHTSHIGRQGRGGSHGLGGELDSPYTQATKLRNNHARHSRPNSPRSPQSVSQKPSALLFGRKEQLFDYDAEGADDERTPLIGTVRTQRSGRQPVRRLNSSNGHSIDDFYTVRQRSRCSRFSGCLLGVCVFAAVILSAIAFLVMSNRPLYDVRVNKIQNVLASEQEIMLDLLVGAINPNALSIAVAEMDVNVFAKSKHVGTNQLWQDHERAELAESEVRHTRRRRQQPSSDAARPDTWQDLSGHWHRPGGGVDHGTDPPGDGDLENDAQTMLLGRILHFDQALTFEGSPIKRHLHYSVGELRLMRPGNKTEAGGSARWENVLKYPFELIIRGVLKYQLPISSRMQSAAVAASILVHPEDGVDRFGNMRLEKVDHREHWQWVDWEDLAADPGGDEARVVEVAVDD